MSDSPVLKTVSSEMDDEFSRPGFMRIIRGGFNVEKVKIPPPFWKTKKGKILSDYAIILNGPFGGSWPILVSQSSRGLFMTEGWKKFYENHGLKEYDLLVFNLSGDSAFDVKIFGDNGVEKLKDSPPEVPIVKKKRGRPSKNKDATNPTPIVDSGTYSSTNPAPPVTEIAGTRAKVPVVETEIAGPQAKVPVAGPSKPKDATDSIIIVDSGSCDLTDPALNAAEHPKPQANVPAVKKKRGRPCKNKDAANSIPIVNSDTYTSVDRVPSFAGLAKPQAIPNVKKKRGRPCKNNNTIDPICIVGNTYSLVAPAPPVTELTKSQANVLSVEKKRGSPCKNKNASNPISFVSGNIYSSTDHAPPITGSQAKVPVEKKKRRRLIKSKDATNPIPIVNVETYSSSEPAPSLARGPNNDHEAMATPSNKAVMLSKKGKILSRYVESTRDEKS